ncbi:MAG: hypothetical protein ACKVP7_17635 [Hyphomicrobiaceae bacterium]
MSKTAYIFVAIIFTLLGASFIASTAFMLREFATTDAETMVIAHSHVFIFFPLLGLVALAAFYLPSVIFTDHYLTNLGWFGWVRFGVGFIAVATFAWFQATRLSSQDLRAIWEVAPTELTREAAAGPLRNPGRCTDVAKVDALRQARERGENPPAGDLTKPCSRQPILTVLRDLRDKAQHRAALSTFSRNCKPDALLEKPAIDDAERYCFPAGQKLNAADCCRIQGEFASHVRNLYVASATRSKTADFEASLFFAKAFFLSVLLVIGLFLLIWRHTLKKHYAAHRPAMERGIMIGAIVLLFWVLMDYGYQQTTDVLFGRNYDGVNPRISLLFIPWAVLLLFYFMERLGEDLERVAQIATIVGTGFTLLRYQEINDWTARLLGVGAANWHFAIVAVIGLLGLVAILRPSWLPTPAKPHADKPVGVKQ